MSELARKVPAVMDTAEFLAWDAPSGSLWQLVDGEPQAMAPASRTHGAIQNELGRLIGNHLVAQAQECSVITNAGTIPRIRADANFRIPDLAVTCSDYQEEEYDVSEPVLMVEILSPTNKTETWSNVWAYTTIPTVREILILHSVRVRAELLRRDAEGQWPERPVVIEDGALELASIGFSLELRSVYRGTRLTRSQR
ncbi:MAG TPA: Uma2 family endonuclease [Acetobacteraceae bacterium]|jgi:Uma2 family endonuclease